MSNGNNPGIDRSQSLWQTDFMGIRTIQNWDDLYIWERILTTYPVKQILEIGSGNGGLSLYLKMQAVRTGALFATFDTYQSEEFTKHPLAKVLGMFNDFHQGDIWLTGEVEKLLTRAHPLLLLCDGGDKPREFQKFVPMLQPGDLVAVHDWLNEFGPGDYASIAHMVEMLEEAMCTELHAMSRWFRRI